MKLVLNSEFRELQGIEKGESIRPYLTTEQIKAVETLQRIDIGLLVVFPEYETRKSALERYFESQQAKMLKGA